MERSKLEKFISPGKGNGLRARASLRPGDLLFESDPLAYTVSKIGQGVVCDHCLCRNCFGILVSYNSQDILRPGR